MKAGHKWMEFPGILFLLIALGSGLSAQTTAGKSPAKNKSGRAPATTADIEQLKQALAAQQQQIQQLVQQMQQREAAFQQAQQQSQQQLQQAQTTAAEAQARATSLESSAKTDKASVDQLSTTVADLKTSVANTAVATQQEQKRVSAVEDVLGRFRVTGDIRVRGESFFQNYSGCVACLDRNRARIRVRFGLDGKLNEDFIGGFAIATGSLGDPTTTNETLTNFFDRKTIGLDRGYITYNPTAHKWLALTGGKFAFPWQRTSVTFDPDINPEGFDEKLSWDLKGPALKNITVQGMELLFSENNTPTFLRAHDAFAVGGQVSGKVDLGFMTSTPSATILNFLNTDTVLNASAFAVAATTSGYVPSATGANPTPKPITFPVPGEGTNGGCPSFNDPLNSPNYSGIPSVPPCAFGANGLTNSTFIGADGKPHFASHFMYGDLILNNQFKTPWKRLPVNLMLEAEQNLRAAGHPIGAKGTVQKNLGRQSHAYLIDFSVGQSKNRGDFQLGYAWEREEQDAIIASWGESDQRAPTNILQNRFYGIWRVRQNILASATVFYGRTLNQNLQHAALAPGWSPSKGPEPYLLRPQFDLAYSF
jgi:Putative porin